LLKPPAGALLGIGGGGLFAKDGPGVAAAACTAWTVGGLFAIGALGGIFATGALLIGAVFEIGAFDCGAA